MKKVSVIIPTYRRIESLKICILSLLNQTYQNYEIIIVDSFSDDGTFEFVSKLSTKHSNIFYYNSEKKGPQYQRSIGILNSSGDFVQFVDSDDYVCANFIQDAVNAMSCGADIGIIYDFKGSMIANSGKIITGNFYQDILKNYRLHIGGSSCWSRIIKTKIAKSIVKYYNALDSITYEYEDLVFVFGCHIFSKSLIYLDTNNYVHNLDRLDSITNESNAGNIMTVFDSINIFNLMCQEIIDSKRQINFKTISYPFYFQLSKYLIFISSTKSFVGVYHEIRALYKTKKIINTIKYIPFRFFEYTKSDYLISFFLRYHLKLMLCVFLKTRFSKSFSHNTA